MEAATGYSGLAFAPRQYILTNTLTLRRWHLLNITLDKTGYSVTIDGNQIFQSNSGDLTNWNGSGTVTLQAGDFDGWLQDLVVRNIQGTNGVVTHPPPPPPGYTPQLTALPLNPDGTYQVRVQSGTNTPYVVEASTDLVTWYPIYTQFFGGLLVYLIWPRFIIPSRFYRARMLNSPSGHDRIAPDYNGYSQVYVAADIGVPFIIQSSTNGVSGLPFTPIFMAARSVFSDPNSLNSPALLYQAVFPDLSTLIDPAHSRPLWIRCCHYPC